jgi:hypothetical protein
MTPGAGLRVLRAVVFTAVSVLLSAGGHLIVTGVPLPVATLLLASALLFGTALLLTATERRYREIAGLLIPVELALNALFNTTREQCSTGLTHGAAHWPGLVVCGGGSVRPGLIGATATPGNTLAGLTAGQMVLLLLLHVLLALLFAAWLWRGEVAVFTVLRAAVILGGVGLRALLALLLSPAPAPTPPAWTVPPLEPVRLGPQEALRRTTRRRGPPVLAPAC